MTYGKYPNLSLVRRALVIKLRHHGDVLLTTPLFSQLKHSLKDASIDAFIYKDSLPMLEGHPAIDNYLLYDRGWKKESFLRRLAHEGRLWRQIRSGRYDLVINLTEGDRGALAARISGASCRVGMAASRSPFARYTHLIKEPALPRHTVEKHLDALRVIGIFPQPEQRDLVLDIPSVASERVTQLLQGAGYPLNRAIVIHPVSRWRYKCASVQQIATLLKKLHAQGHPLILSAGPDPVEKEMISQILALASGIPVFNSAGLFTLKELAALIQGCRALICVDSVPLHIASATKTPVVALFGPTSDKTWGPWMHDQAEIVTRPFSCRPCYQDGCGGSKMSDCLFTIPPQQVIAALDTLLNRS